MITKSTSPDTHSHLMDMTVLAQAAASKTTAWASWDRYMTERKAVAQPSSDEKSMFAAIGKSISSSVAGFKPKHSSASGASDQTKAHHVEKVRGSIIHSPSLPMLVTKTNNRLLWPLSLLTSTIS